jgi:hypothetical protein
MAAITLERLAAGIKAANAKGDIEAVKRLGSAYRQMQGQANPAFEAASLASQTLSGKVADLPSQRPSMADEAMSFGRGIIEGIPVAGPALADARRGLDANLKALLHGGDAGQYQDEFKAADEALREKTGGARTAGNITGSVAALAPLGMTSVGGRLLGTVGSLPQRLAMGSGSGALLSGADTAARGGDGGEVLNSALLGAGLGTVFPAAGAIKNKIGQSIAQRSATTSAIKNAPAASELKATASALFENSRAANAGVNADTFKNFAAGLVQKATKADIDPDLDGQAMAAYRRMVEMANEAAETGSISLSRLHNLRQLAQDVVIEAKKPRTKNFAGDIVQGLDDLIGGLKPDQMVGAGGKQAANDMLEGISTWARAKKLAILEEAITQAEFQASGVTNGLRLKFQAILRNPKTRSLFNQAELAEIKRVANGGVVDNIARLIGKFGFGLGNNGNNVVGGSIGLALGGIPGMMVGSAARKGSEILTTRAAERAAKAVATPNLPVLPKLPAPNGMLPPALLPLEVTKKREPLLIEVRGGR